jgi:hypothetical protein
MEQKDVGSHFTGCEVTKPTDGKREKAAIDEERYASKCQ